MSITGRSLAPALLLLCLMAFASQSFADGGINLSTSEGALSGTDRDLSSSASIFMGVEGLATWILSPATATGDRSFAADGYGMNGIPHGMLFFGTFSGPLTWVITNLTNETHNYTLTGMVSLTLGGKIIEGKDSKLTI